MDEEDLISKSTEQILPGKKSRATSFELSIKDFFTRLQFDDVDGARDNFLIGGVQVDACAGHEENALLFVECTMKQTLGKKTLRDKINELRGKIELLKKGARKDEKYRKYKFFKYILAVKNIDVSHSDFEYANSGERIYILHENSINYYEDLYSKIKQYAKFNLLGEIGVRPSQQNLIQIPASMTTFGKIKMFSFFVNPSFLLEVCYVARRELPNERYYQRIIDKERLKKIASYVNDGNVLPNNIIIAFGENVKKYVKFHESPTSFGFKQQLMQFGVTYGCLEFPKDYRSCWVIDGQHRLYSFIDVQKPVNMPVVAFQDLDIEKQCKIFLDINKFQKPVSADLVWDLNGDMIPSEPDGIISNVVKLVNDNPEAPLFHRIYIPSKGIRRSKSGLLKMAAICLAIKRMKLASQITHSKTRNPFYDNDAATTTRRLAKALAVYFSCLKQVLNEDWEKEEKGFSSTDGAYGVYVRIFEKIVSRMKDKIYPEEKDYLKYLSPLKQLFEECYPTPDDLKKLRLSVTSEGGKSSLALQFILFIREKTSDNYFGGEIESLGMKEIRDLEGRLKLLIKQKLKTEDSYDWLKGKLPEEVYGRLEKRMKSHNQNDYDDLHLQLTFGECVNILRTYKDIFYADFKNEDFGFNNEKAIEVAFEHISNIRNTQHSHTSGVSKKTEDEDLFRIYLYKINKCLDEILSEEVSDQEEDTI